MTAVIALLSTWIAAGHEMLIARSQVRRDVEQKDYNAVQVDTTTQDYLA
jgi:hypothetical protein